MNDISISSDGTAKGTIVKNGKKIIHNITDITIVITPAKEVLASITFVDTAKLDIKVRGKNTLIEKKRIQ